ncbi:MAG: contractile injection system protein, VgrG/Pvc8 family [Betaproteobacteria bacterium]|nr:contractile injection system protein, VgrG/Pvc8 family [Betaproteobacteria bacterium]
MPDGTAARLTAARPGIAIDGAESAALQGGLLDLVIREAASGLYRCEALFNNWGMAGGQTGFLHFDRRALDFGKGFEVRLGRDKLFAGRIMALEGEFPEGAPPRIRVLAEDRLQDLRMARRTRSFENVSDAQAITRVAQDHGLTPQVNLSGPTYKVLAQVNQSDLAFVRERARATGGEVWVDGSTLHVDARPGRAAASFKLAIGATLREFRVTADLASQCTKLTVGGWDVSAKEAIKGEAEASAAAGEVGGDEGGAAILQNALGERKQSVAHAAPLASDEARAIAKARFLAAARRFVVGQGVAETDVRLRVGATVELEGLGPLFAGKYYVAATCTRFDSQRGLRTEFTAERPGLGRP